MCALNLDLHLKNAGSKNLEEVPYDHRAEMVEGKKGTRGKKVCCVSALPLPSLIDVWSSPSLRRRVVFTSNRV